MTLIEAYKESLKKLKNPDIDEINIRILLCEINSLKTMSDFYLHKNDNIRDLHRYYSYLDRFLGGEPVEYIIGKTSFFGNEFFVDNRVLIPRQESEEVVDFAIRKIEEYFPNKKLTVADVCCGSGIMGISLAKKCNVNHSYFVDISKDAIDVTNINLVKNNVLGQTFCGDCLEPLISNNIKVDVLISNPPYVLKDESVDKSVLEYEPHIALFADEDFSIYKRIISNLEKIKNNSLLTVFEIGLNTRKVLEAYLNDTFPNYQFEFAKDMNGKERILYIFIK